MIILFGIHPHLDGALQLRLKYYNAKLAFYFDAYFEMLEQKWGGEKQEETSMCERSSKRHIEEESGREI